VGLLGIIVNRLDGTVVEINPYLERMLGYSRESLVSGAVRWLDLTPPGWSHVDALAIEQIRATGVGALREKEYLRANGVRVPVMVGSAQIGDGPDIISFILDLTESKRAEAALNRFRAERAIAERFRAVFEAAPDAILVTDATGRITFVNGQAERLLGHSRDELLASAMDVLIPGRPGPDRPDRVGRRKDGSEFPIELTESTLETNDGPLAVTAVRDITERRNAERVVLRAKAAAESANRELEAFSYSVAHDLRAPLRAMGGFAQILLEEHGEKLDDGGRDLVHKVVRASHRMASLVDGLLGLARLNRTQPRRERVNLSQMARGSLSRVLEECGSTRPPTEVVIEDGLWVDADPSLLEAVVDNLVDNAVKFTGRTPAPRIELGRIERPGGSVFFLRDNGAGFDMEFSNKLFTPFQRLHRVTEFAGSGIGLATVQRIVGRHGGRIWAEGRVGEGAVFYFTLPAYEAVER
jgi:PAS domain S-box-containing protein